MSKMVFLDIHFTMWKVRLRLKVQKQFLATFRKHSFLHQVTG